MPGQAAYIKSSSGAIEKVDSKDLAAALAEDDGASVATKSEVKHAQNQEKYGTGVGAGLKALGAGALRGATLGASDYLARKASPELADQLAYLKEDQGLMSGIGEVGGMVIPSLLSGGAGAAAEGASALGTAAKGARLIGAPARALTAAGDIAEHGIASLVGSGAEGLIARSLQKGASIAGRGVLEGGILGAANEISEASLGDHELNAERILASAGHGAILGGLVGGGLGIGAELATTGTRKLAGKILNGRPRELPGMAEAAPMAAAEAETGGERVANALGGESLVDQVNGLAAKVPDDVKALGKGLLKEEGEHINRQLANLDLEGQSYEHVIRSAGGTKAQLQTLRKYGDARTVGKIGYEELPQFAGLKNYGQFSGREQLETASVLGRKSAGEAMGAGVSSADEFLAPHMDGYAKAIESQKAATALLSSLSESEQAAIQYGIKNGANSIGEVAAAIRETQPGIAKSLLKKAAPDLSVTSKLEDIASKHNLVPKVGDVTGLLKKEVLADLEKHAGTRAQQGVVKDFISEIESIHGPGEASMTLTDLKNRIVDAGKKAKWTPADAINANEVYQKIRNVLEDDLENRMGIIAEASGNKKLLADYIKNKQRYQAFKFFEKATGSGVAANGSNQAFSIADKIRGAGGGLLGAAAGTLFGPLGTVGGGAIGNFVTEAASKYARQRFDFVAAEALHRASQLKSLSKLSIDFDKSMEGAISSLMTKHTVEPAVSAAARLWGTGKKRTENIEKTINNVVRIAHDPPRAIDAIANRVNGLSQVAPNTAAALSGQAARSMMYLYSNLPQSKAAPSMFNPNPKPFYSETDILKFANRLMAVEDPTTIIEDLRKGQLQPESVEAVKTVYPKLFADMQNKIMQQSLSLQSTMPYEKQVQLGMLFDVPVNPTLEPDFMRAVQGSMVQSTGQQTQSGGLPPVAQNKSINSQYSTEADKLEGDR